DARRIIPMAEAPPPRGDGIYGAKFGGKPLTMVILGDSSAAGYGVHRPRETPGALLATGVSRRLHRPVKLYRVAVVGAMSSGLPYQVDAALEYEPDVAVILIGGNDVTHVSARAMAVRYLGDSVRRLYEAAQECVNTAGTEASPTKVGGREQGPAGRWAVLRKHPWFGEPRTWFGHKAPVPSGRPAAGAVGWTPADQ